MPRPSAARASCSSCARSSRNSARSSGPPAATLLSYTGVVLVFVVVMMLFVSALDYGIGKLVLLVFGSGS